MSDLKYHLEDSISLGYQFIEKIEEEYRNPPNGGLSVLLDKWYRIIKEWEEQVKRGLSNNSRRMAFSQAKSNDISYESGKSVDVQNLIKSIRAKIQILEELYELDQKEIIDTVREARSRTIDEDRVEFKIENYI
mgnify:CR=1 FL=1